MKFSRIRLIVKDTFIQFSPQKRKNKMMHNTLDREGGSRKYILLVLGTFCTQCTKFKIVPYDILRCAHRTFGVRHAAAATIGHFLSHPECELHF